MVNQNFKQNNKLIFSENANEIIDQLIEKYKLDKEIEEEVDVRKRLEGVKSFLQKEGIKFIFSKKVEEELKKGKKLDEILASRKLRKIIEMLGEGKTSSEKTVPILQKSFDLTQKDAEKLNKEIQENLRFLVVKKISNEKNIEEEKLLSENLSIKKGATESPQKDVYKEPIE